MKVGGDEPATLMLLNSNGTALEMLRYKACPVARSRDGKYHMVIQRGAPSWLPCWTASLIEEIDEREFPGDLTITREEYENLWAERYASCYRVAADGVHPRYAISVERLQQGLKEKPMAIADFSCRQQVQPPVMVDAASRNS